MFLVAAVVSGLAAGGCSASNEVIHGFGTTQTWTLSTSPRVAAADGKVSVLAGKDGNQMVDVQVQRLAKASRVFEGTSTYVVWLVPPDSPPTNIGVLPLDSHLKGRLQTKTPYREFDVEVTAEPAPTATQPNAQTRVMSVSVRLPT
jgi:hypothetical protein